MKDNKLLAEYLGFRYSENTEGLYINAFQPTLEPHGQCTLWSPKEDWNQLMMVVEKIKDVTPMFYLELWNNDSNSLSPHKWECSLYEEAILSTGETAIGAVYNACVQYIKLSNES